MTTGSEIARSLARKREEVESSLRDVADRIHGLERDVGQVMAEEGRLWSAFAAIQIGEAVSLPGQVESMLDKRSGKIEAAKSGIKASQDRIASLSERRETAAAQADKDAKALGEQQDAVKAKLDADPVVRELRVDLARLDEIVGSLLEKGKRAVLERDEKGGAYESDEFFRYLSRRGFGTPKYAGWGVAAHLDSWLANLISYRKKSADYQRLQDIPAWIQDRSDKAEADRSRKAAELKTIVDRETLALKPFRKAAEASAEALSKIEADIAAERESIHDASRLLSEAALATDEDMKRITSSFAEMLSRKGIRDIAAAAARTATKEDDAIVEKLEALGREKSSLASQIAGLKPGLMEFEKRIAAIKEVENKLRSRGWTGSSHRFGSVPSSAADDLSQGVITSAALWSMMQSSHRHESSHSSYGSGYGSSHSSSSDYGGGFGGGSFSSGGGFGGGGFSTGGGF